MTALRLRTAQFSAQGIKVGLRSVVLQLASDLGLLGLSSAAPHGSTPSPGLSPESTLSGSFSFGHFRKSSVSKKLTLLTDANRNLTHSPDSGKTRVSNQRQEYPARVAFGSRGTNLPISANGANGLLPPHYVVTLKVMTAEVNDSEPLLTPAEVAAMFRVDPKTVTRWAKAGKLSSVRTLGGHRRYLASEVRALLDGSPAKAESVPAPPPPAPVLTSPEARGLEPLPPPPPTSGSSAGLPSR